MWNILWANRRRKETAKCKKKLLSIELHFLKYISSNVVCVFFSKDANKIAKEKKTTQRAPAIRCWEFLIEFEMKHLIAFVDANIETLQLMLKICWAETYKLGADVRLVMFVKRLVKMTNQYNSRLQRIYLECFN